LLWQKEEHWKEIQMKITFSMSADIEQWDFEMEVWWERKLEGGKIVSIEKS
jgi:hypothetical protein